MNLLTWNLQRKVADGVAVDTSADIRVETLKLMLENTDVLFMQEVNVNSWNALKNAVQDMQLGWYVNPDPDGQTGNTACRSVIVARSGLQILTDTFRSGGEKAYRLPVSIYDAGNHTIFSSVHFTSSAKAKENFKNYVALDPATQQPALIANNPWIPNNWRWIIGADFNFEANGAVPPYNTITQPITATQMSGRRLDGFCSTAHGTQQPALISHPAEWTHPSVISELYMNGAPGRPTGTDGLTPVTGWCITHTRPTQSGRTPKPTVFVMSDHMPVSAQY